MGINNLFNAFLRFANCYYHLKAIKMKALRRTNADQQGGIALHKGNEAGKEKIDGNGEVRQSFLGIFRKKIYLCNSKCTYYNAMNISYKWLKEYVDFDMSANEVADALTSIGLEVDGVEEVQAIKGGLEGLVVGHVLTCEVHPNSDHMHICTVDVGTGEAQQIVCGAPNVAAGQKVIVATLGTKLYNGDECFTIKRSKLRGVESLGMICAEDEIGVGKSHDGIIVLPEDTPVGLKAAEYYGLESDFVIEVDITPNRADACSHYGVARDFYVW